MGDKFSEIERLGELKDKGLLTEKEFQAEKSKLLKQFVLPTLFWKNGVGFF